MKLKKFWTMSTYRLLLLLIVVVLPLNVLTLMLGNLAVNDVEKQITEETQNVMNLYMNQLDISTKQITTQLHRCAVENTDFAKLNTRQPADKNEYYEKMQSAIRLRHTLSDILENVSLFTGVYVIYPENEITLMECTGVYNIPYKAELENYIYTNFISDTKQNEPQKCQIVFLEDAKLALFITHYRYSVYGAWIEIDKLARELDFQDPENGTFLFTTEDGEILFRNIPSLTEDILTENADDIMIDTESKYLGIHMIQLIRKRELTRLLPEMIKMVRAFSILAVAILPIILIFTKRWMIAPMNRLIRAMQEIEAGNMQYRITEKESGSEFEQINHNFNNVMDQVSKLKIDIYEEKLEKQRIRMRFLSQQIQPHFILNTINILYSYDKEEYSLIQEMLLCLADYFRYIVNAGSDFIELEKEMEHIRNYFNIQTHRYPSTFFAMVEFDEELGECMIPPLLIQNFAENAIKHSIKVGNQIDIFVIAQCYQENKMRIRIMDTGDGMAPELIEKVKVFQKTGKYQEGLGVGIPNAIERLNILYGDHKELYISREQPHGTKIEIILPVLRREDIETNEEE